MTSQLDGLEKSFADLHATIVRQDETILNLDHRLQTETEVSKVWRKKVGQLETQLDALEQYGRRYCVRVEGIPEDKNETEDQLFTTLKTKLKDIDINLQRGDLVNFHRSAKPKKHERGTTTQQCIMKFYKWGPRRAFYGMNKKARAKNLPIRVHNDLTRRRFDALLTAQRKIAAKFGESNECFAYSDINSNLKVRTPDGYAVPFDTADDVDSILQDFE